MSSVTSSYKTKKARLLDHNALKMKSLQKPEGTVTLSATLTLRLDLFLFPFSATSYAQCTAMDLREEEKKRSFYVLNPLRVLSHCMLNSAVFSEDGFNAGPYCTLFRFSLGTPPSRPPKFDNA